MDIQPIEPSERDIEFARMMQVASERYISILARVRPYYDFTNKVGDALPTMRVGDESIVETLAKIGDSSPKEREKP